MVSGLEDRFDRQADAARSERNNHTAAIAELEAQIERIENTVRDERADHLAVVAELEDRIIEQGAICRQVQKTFSDYIHYLR